MTYDVSDAEKQEAERAIIYFNSAIKLLALASDHLNIMKTPFKENNDITPESVMKARAAIRRFRDQAVKNFNNFKIVSFKCVRSMQIFMSDTQTVKLMKSFINSIDDLENKVNDFVKLFDSLDDQDFSKNVVAAIEEIQKQCEEINEIADDRIIDHIRTNILANNWVDSISSELQTKIEKKTPLIVDLFNQRQEQLNQELKNRLQSS
jgi:chaperonin cofactor prefoldin